MKKFTLFTFLSFIAIGFGNIYGATYEVPGRIMTIVKKISNGSSIQYLEDNSQTIGHFRNNIEEKTYRSLVWFDISDCIPVNSNITSVKIRYFSSNIQALNYMTDQLSFSLVNPQLHQSVYENAFPVIGSSQVLVSSPYIVNRPNNEDWWGDASSPELTNTVISFSGRDLKLGFFSDSENESNSLIKYTLKLIIETSSSPQYARMSVNNNFSPNHNLYWSGEEAGGLISVDGITKETPVYFYKNFGETTTFQAIPGQFSYGYEMVWADNVELNKSDWKLKNKIASGIPLSNNITYTTEAANSGYDLAMFTANFRRKCYITVHPSNPDGGIVKIIKEGIQYDVPATGNTKDVIEKNLIILKAFDETKNNIKYIFEGWKNEQTQKIVSTNKQWSINPEYDSSYTAVFTGYADVSMMNVQDNANSVGAYPTITWTDNPNQNVSYRISGSYEPINLSTWSTYAIIAPGIQTYTAPSKPITGDKYNCRFFTMKIEALYTVENTLRYAAAPNYYLQGNLTEPIPPGDPASKKSAGLQKDAVITNYAVANYPNPFNPTTVINYQVPETGFITLKVYDVMGKEITTLFDGVKAKGNHNVNFSMDQYHLASGIYFCRLTAGKNVVTTKMILSK